MAAEVAMAREKGAYLLSSDTYMHVFRDYVMDITGRSLDVRRPEAAG